MFIVNLTYIVDLDTVDQYLEAHVSYLKRQYEQKHFLASGRKNPRDGGVILVDVESRDKLMPFLAKDPFRVNSVASYEIIDFTPSMVDERLAFLQEK